ncbi:MAG: hypothetical protein ACI9PX_000706, partial [Reinekea sp.]
QSESLCSDPFKISVLFHLLDSNRQTPGSWPNADQSESLCSDPRTIVPENEILMREDLRTPITLPRVKPDDFCPEWRHQFRVPAADLQWLRKGRWRRESR